MTCTSQLLTSVQVLGLVVLNFLKVWWNYMGVSKNRGGPPKWMVKIMEHPIEMDDLGVPLFSETPTSWHALVYMWCVFFSVAKMEHVFEQKHPSQQKSSSAKQFMHHLVSSTQATARPVSFLLLLQPSFVWVTVDILWYIRQLYRCNHDSWELIQWWLMYILYKDIISSQDFHTISEMHEPRCPPNP